MTKTGSEALEYIKHVKPIPGKTVILVLAMTAGDYYGPNRNGDGWPEHPLEVNGTKITADDVLPKHYHTFEDGHVFQHHVNKDPAKSIGEVLKSFYNWPMHRVELLLALDNEKAQKIIQKIENGDFPAVSMGCFPAGNLVTMADGTRKPIELIRVGDRVLTHKGNAKRVTQTHKRLYKGPLYRIKLPVYPELTCTEEHPFWATDIQNLKKKTYKGYHRWNSDAKPNCDWTHAKCLDDHLLFEPIRKKVRTPDYVTRSFARLFGYYLAEGHVVFGQNRKPMMVSLSVNRDDAILDEIHDLCASYGTRNEPNISPRSHTEHALTIDISDAELATLCLEHGGRYGRRKRLSESALLWDPQMQREMIGAYANGDGHGTKNGSLSMSTASPDLAWQLVSVLHRLGITPSIQSLEHKAGSGFSKRNTYEWVVFIGKQWAQGLRGVCSKITSAEIRAKRNDRKIFRNQIASPIRHITTEPSEVYVHNLEVEDDESYVVNGASVHNCRIKFDVCSVCGHKAPSTDKYCSHAKNLLGRILPDGRWVFVWNPSPRFFDISAVIRPADRIGYMLKKVAEENPNILPSAVLGAYLDNTSKKIAALGKLSVLHKLINGMGVLTARQSNSAAALDQLRKQVAEPVAEKMPELGDDALRTLSKHRPAKVFSTLSSMGILLTTPEFIKFFIWQLDPTMEIPDDVLDRAVALQGQIFEFLADHPNLLDEIDSMNYLKTGSQHVDSELAGDLHALIPLRSQQDHLLYKRAIETPKLCPTGLGYTRKRNNARRRPGLEKLAGTAALFASAYALSPWNAGTDLIVEPHSEIGHEGAYSKYAGFDTANAAVRLAMDQRHRQLEKKAIRSALPDSGASVSFEAAISLVGKAVCS